MGRPPLPVGTAGEVRVYATRTGYRACCKFRDFDGVTRPIERHAKTKGKARDALREAIRDRVLVDVSAEINANTTVKELGDAWFAELGQRDVPPAEGTLRAYRDRLDKQVFPALGALRVREVTVSRVDRVVKAVKEKHGPSVAKVTRTVLSGLFGMAVRHDAMESNPARDVASIQVQAKAPTRALELEEAQVLRAKIHANEQARGWDLPDLTDFMLATGLRIGEAAAVTWDALDLDEGTVEVRGTVVRVKGVGLMIQPKPKSKAGFRKLELPGWAVAMLKRRKGTAKPNQWGVVFTAPLGGLRDPSNTQADLRVVFKAAGFEWVTSHVYRKTVATLMDEAGLSARQAADQLGHAKVSMTQDSYFGRRRASTGAKAVLEGVIPGAGDGK
ncbi:integrase [Crossiella equi]|uniref:Integrase n=1 Tax=Crossiella equi TaxID=130796 RepID=A0ABS5ACV6_9PSEU|nr:site-specific integrase [Crossiella equi]MBP2474039.1 integrase [Crossiella equi]